MVDINLVALKSDIPKNEMRVPLGICYLSSSLKQAGYSVRCQDLNFERVRLDCKYLGITVPTFCYDEAHKVVRKAKTKGVITIAGGPHAYVDAQSLLDIGFDYVIIGDGEKSIVELSDTLEKNKQHPKITSSFSKNLDSIPFPDFSWINWRHYISDTIPLSTSRDCPFSCSFCLRPTRRWRSRSPENIISEISRYQGLTLEIMDDVFTLDKKRIFRLRDLIQKENLDVGFSLMNGVRVDSLNNEVIHALRDINTTNINIGVESVHPEVLAFCSKGITVEQAEDCIRLLKRHGYRRNMCVYMIVGLPKDTFERSMYSIRWVEKQRVESSWCLATPFPKTDMFNWVNKNATWLIDPKDYANYCGLYSRLAVMFETKDFTKEQRLRAILRAKAIGRTWKGKISPFLNYLIEKWRWMGGKLARLQEEAVGK